MPIAKRVLQSAALAAVALVAAGCHDVAYATLDTLLLSFEIADALLWGCYDCFY